MRDRSWRNDAGSQELWGLAPAVSLATRSHLSRCCSNNGLKSGRPLDQPRLQSLSLRFVEREDPKSIIDWRKQRGMTDTTTPHHLCQEKSLARVRRFQMHFGS